MEPTVVLSLQDYKDLESRANAYDSIKSDCHIVYRSSYGDYTIMTNDEALKKLLNDLKQAIDSRDQMIEKMNYYKNKKRFFIW